MASRTRTIRQRRTLPARPADVYRAFTDPRLHAAVTQARATGAPRVGARFTAWDGYISGRHLELVPGRRIVQEWITTEWPPGAPPSRLALSFRRVSGGTQVQLVHAHVPAEQADGYRQGWIDYYWAPLKAYFERA